ncbi:hypothetical protein PITC_053710 [Penicillium italicum]|uniref:Uncharacterized protein n=1 Tax=Penicillium italicum TaxID=40296 RepID=A0A0A2KMF2_PENIT|nr:hypothetical protein PITC_053710 [Penicillium italicum]
MSKSLAPRTIPRNRLASSIQKKQGEIDSLCLPNGARIELGRSSKILFLRNFLKPKRERMTEPRKIQRSPNNDLSTSHILFPGLGSHQASLITRPARSSSLYTDFESTASFRLGAEKRPSPRQIPAQTLAY